MSPSTYRQPGSSQPRERAWPKQSSCAWSDHAVFHLPETVFTPFLSAPGAGRQLWASKRRLGRLDLGREQGGEGSTLWVRFSLRCAPAAGLLQAFTRGLRGIIGAVRKSTRLSPRNINVPLNSRLCLQSGTEMGSPGKQHAGSPWAV